MWQIVLQTELCWAIFEDEHLVYNPISGNTHLLDAEPARLLKALEQKPQTTFELSEMVFLDNSTIEGTPQEIVESIIHQLQSLSLVEAC